MEINKILNADVLDIIFDGKNKEYGAYQLRKNYSKRLATSLVSMGSILLLLFIGTVLANVLAKKKPVKMVVAQEVTFEKIPEPKKQELILPPTQKTIPPPKIQSIKITPPQIVPDNQVEKVDELPPVEKANDAKIAAFTQEGSKDEGIIAPPIEAKGTANIVAPKVEEEDYDRMFVKVEKPATFLGGADAWRRFLERAMSNYPEKAVENGTQGLVKVQMVVDKDGNITDVVALNNPGDGLGEYAVNIIKKGPKWIPAEQNGRKVTYRFVQTITFQLQ